MRHSCSISVTYVTYTMILLVKRPFHLTEAILVVIAHQWWNLLESRGEIPLVRRQSLLRKNTSRSLIFVGVQSPTRVDTCLLSRYISCIRILVSPCTISWCFALPKSQKFDENPRNAAHLHRWPCHHPSHPKRIQLAPGVVAKKKVWLTKKALGCSGDMDMSYVYCLVISLAIDWCIHGILLYHLFKISWNLCKYVCIEIERGREKEKRERERGR